MTVDVNFKIKVIVNIFDTSYISGEDYTLHQNGMYSVHVFKKQQQIYANILTQYKN